MKLISAFLILVAMHMGMQASNPAYELYTSKGKKTTFKKLVKDALGTEVILFGEQHNDPICHWLQLELARAMYKEINGNLVIGAEMFERDDQLVIDEYFAGHYSKNNFEKEAKLWNNFKTDYLPLFSFALENNVKYVATNIPRRYASLVAHEGLPALRELSGEAKSYMPPLPVAFDSNLPAYKQLMEMPMHQIPYMAQAQAVKDATMAHFIHESRKEGQVMLHLNGSFHSNNFEGIYWYLRQKDEDLRIITIATVQQEDISELEEENSGLADYIICVPSDMTKTY